MYKTIYTLLFLLGLNYSLFAQKATSYTISGNVKDAATGEDLIGAIIKIEELKNTGAVSNIYGFYSISLTPGNYTLTYSFMGYRTKSIKVKLDKNIFKIIELEPSAQNLSGY